MKRSFWIVGAAILAAVVVGGGVTWWLLSSGQDSPQRPPVDTSSLVYTGEDLAGFLIGQQAAQEIIGSEITMAAADNYFPQETAASREPSACTVVTGPLTLSPAGFRDVNGGYFEGAGATGHALHLSQAAYQFRTIQDATDAFAQIEEAWKLCDHFVETFGIASTSFTPSDARLTAVDPSTDREDLVAAVIDYTGGQEKSIAVVTLRVNNVITLGQVLSSGPAAGSPLDKDTVHRLAAAVIDQAGKAEQAKAAGQALTMSAPPVWEIGFGSIGPLDIAMTAQQASDIMGNNGPLYVEMDFCSSYFLGVHNESSISGLAESQGASGHLDSISTFASWGTEPLDASELSPYRPRTATGISTGSTMADLEAAYPGKLEIKRHQYVEGGHYAYLDGPGDTMIKFDLDPDDMVVGITTGRDPQTRYVEGCA